MVSISSKAAQTYEPCKSICYSRAAQLGDAMTDIGQFSIVQGGLPVAEGSNVQCAVHRPTGTKVILKACRLQEAVIQMRLQLDAGVAKVFAVLQASTPDKVVVVQDYYDGGELLDIIPKRGLVEPKAAPLIKQLASTVGYLHQEGIAHRDIKLDNIVLAADGTPRLIDFGSAVCTGLSSSMDQGLAVGTIPYMPPELLDPCPPHIDTMAGDVWALGIVFFALLLGSFPWGCASDLDSRFVAYRARAAAGQQPIGWENLSLYWQTLIGHMLAVDPAARWSISRVQRYLASWPVEPSQGTSESGRALLRPLTAHRPINDCGQALLTEKIISRKSLVA